MHGALCANLRLIPSPTYDHRQIPPHGICTSKVLAPVLHWDNAQVMPVLSFLFLSLEHLCYLPS